MERKREEEIVKYCRNVWDKGEEKKG